MRRGEKIRSEAIIAKFRYMYTAVTPADACRTAVLAIRRGYQMRGA